MNDDSAIQQAHQTLDLDGLWSVTALPLDTQGESGYKTFKQSTAEPLAAQVPGEIHLDLMRVGRMEDPNISDHARMLCRWPEQHSWWYRTEFVPPPGFRAHWRQKLIFDGIDLYGEVFVNGVLAGRTKNAFATVELDVRHLLKEGANELVVRVTSGLELPRPGDYPPLPWSIHSFLEPIYSARFQPADYRRYLRKPAYSAHGWDWCDPLPNIGIWRRVRLEAHSEVAIYHVRLDTAMRDRDVSLEGEVILDNLHPCSEIPAVLELRVTSPQGMSVVQRTSIATPCGRSPVRCVISIPDPQLWWPNGMGEQPLYQLTVRVLCGDQETDRVAQTLGLRTIELDRSALPEGSRFCFKVNGEKVYCKGGNWAPADLIPARIDPERYEKLVKEAKNAHFTMLRVNGTGFYESEAFYDACDREGILVWQDFMFSCAQYPDHDPEFLALVRHEAEGVVKGLRHRASLALWCGNNEATWLMQREWGCRADAPGECGGARLYNEVLPDICRTYDPSRSYWPGSPFGGREDPNSELTGDTHWWGEGEEFFAFEDRRMSQERSDQSRARFVSEYGVLGPAHVDSIREYLKADEISLESNTWKIHTNALEPMSGGHVMASITHHYGDPKHLSLEQVVLYGQMAQALLHGRAVEAMRFRKNDRNDDCQGVLVWSYNDTWGEVGWSLIDHYVRRKASYYGFRRSAAPVKVLVRSRKDHLVTRVVNDTRKTYRAVVRCGWVRLDGSANEFQERPVTIPANDMVEVAAEPLPSIERNPREWLYAATLTREGVAQDQASWLLAPHRELALPQPEVSVTVEAGVLKVSSPVYCHGVHIEDGGHEVIEDNYFDLLPGIPRHIQIKHPLPNQEYFLAAVMPIEMARR